MAGKTLLVAGLLFFVLLAGCSGSGGKSATSGTLGDVPDIEATATTGGIHGFVVDERIVPIKGATVSVMPENKSTTTNADGAFAISGLPAGTYFLKATHPLYNTIQQSVQVEAGVADPKDIKLQLTRLIASTPYAQTLKFDGFMVCGANSPAFISEECGEGVGSPRTTCDEPLVPPPCIANPIFPGQRLAHQADNHIQFDFQPDVGLRSVVIEQVWEPTSDAARVLYSPVGLNWTCVPSCDWDSLGELHGESPTYLYLGPDAVSGIFPGQNITVFTWTGTFDDDPAVVLSQRFTDFATLSYFLPLPDGWSFVKNDAPPF